jgi:hypothetical protein
MIIVGRLFYKQAEKPRRIVRCRSLTKQKKTAINKAVKNIAKKYKK